MSKSTPSKPTSNQLEKASWNIPNVPSPPFISSHPPLSTSPTANPPVYYPRFSPIHTYNLYNKIPDELVDILHRLGQKKQTDAQRGWALSDLQKRLEAVSVLRSWGRKADEGMAPTMERPVEETTAETLRGTGLESEDQVASTGGGRAQDDAFEDDSWVDRIGPLWVCTNLFISLYNL